MNGNSSVLALLLYSPSLCRNGDFQEGLALGVVVGRTHLNRKRDLYLLLLTRDSVCVCVCVCVCAGARARARLCGYFLLLVVP